MSFRHSNAIREIPVDRFEGHTQRYILIEAAHLSDNGGILRYSHDDLANAIGLSRITVSREMNQLEKKGLIIKEKHGQYKINIPLSRQGAVVAEPEVMEDKDTFESWWEESPLVKVDSEGNEVVLVVMDDIPEDVKQYAQAGLIARRPGVTAQPGIKDAFLVYEKVK